MTKRQRIMFGVFGAVLGVVLVGIFLFVGLLHFAMPEFKDQEHLPDHVLIQNFHDHRSEFELLRSMLERDNQIVRIADDWTEPANLSGELVDEYRRLFAVVGTPHGVYNRRTPLRIEFIASARGWVSSGSMKGYVYLRGRPEKTVSDLDRFHNGAGARETSALKHIEGDWYLFFER